VVTYRLADGQLDECDLTLKEVHGIEQSFVKSLCSFYHARIAYPKSQGGAGNGQGKTNGPWGEGEDRRQKGAAQGVAESSSTGRGNATGG
jgi:hypothetical protein